MNKRLKQLASQCQIKQYGVNGELIIDEFDEEKFAELLIHECLTNLEESHEQECGLTESIVRLKGYFGNADN